MILAIETSCDDTCAAVVGEDGVHRLRAGLVCKLGAEGSPTDRDALLPDYLREPDAVPRR